MRNNEGEAMFNEKVYGSVDKELRYRLKLWLTATLIHFFAVNPSGKVATIPQQTTQLPLPIPQQGHVVAEDGDDSDKIAEQRGY
jgi:hypothetical protein